MSKKFFLILLGSLLILLVLSLGTGLWVYEQSKNNNLNKPALVGGSYSLLDHNGKKVTDKSFSNKFKIIYFGYTFCPDICPTGMAIISEALDLLGNKAQQIKPIFITVDPKRDNVEIMAEYHRHFHSSFSNLTGTLDQIKHVAKLYRVYYKKSDPFEAENYLMDHSSIMYVMSPKGEYINHFGPEIRPEQIVAFFDRRLQ
ncbi:MAG: SCO family protein [Rhodospirillaceae bacterium]|nr:SCO family protein [Rhodospirillaceae bacterium]